VEYLRFCNARKCFQKASKYAKNLNIQYYIKEPANLNFVEHQWSTLTANILESLFNVFSVVTYIANLSEHFDVSHDLIFCNAIETENFYQACLSNVITGIKF